MKKQHVFLALTLAMPVLFFALLELGLRLVGFGQSYPLFIPVAEAPAYLRANPDVVRRFITAQAQVPDVAIRPVPFPARKPADSFRIMVQGGSTAAGYPYGFGASPAGMLQQRLQQTFPERDIEVITTAMTAVNSYTLLDFTEEIIAQQPDAVLIYAGHNEYLGLLGVGSTYSAGSSRAVVLAYLALRELRIVQLLERAWRALVEVKQSATPEADSDRTLMARVVREPHIAIDSPLFERGVEQFRANLAALLRHYRRAGIAVFIGTLVSNERDQKPFVNALEPATDAKRWQQFYDSGRDAFRADQPDEAEAALRSAIALDDSGADAWFALGEVLEEKGEFEQARGAFLAAKDRDQLRFRAPEVFNAVIRELAEQHGATVVDVQNRLATESSNGIVGNDLMLEHLHPNLRGYFLLADAYYDALRAAGLIAPWEGPVSARQAWQDVPVTEVDRLNADYQMLRLKADWPFSREPGPPGIPRRTTQVEKIAYALYQGTNSWPEAMRRLLSHYRLKRDHINAARVAVLLADARPYDTALQLEAATLASQVQREPAAQRLLWRTAQAQVSAGDTRGARNSLELLLALAPDHAGARQLLDNLKAPQ